MYRTQHDPRTSSDELPCRSSLTTHHPSHSPCRSSLIVHHSSFARSAFTLIEILIVIVIIGILGAVVLPKFSDASHTARENTLKDDLRYLRTQIIVFKAQHRDVAPGYPAGNMSAAPTEGDFLDQMTKATNEACQVGAGPTFPFGPYVSDMPPNPLNGLDTVLVVPNGGAMPPAGLPDNSTGWIYKPQTLEIIPNSPGTDRDGTAYVEY